MRKKLSLLLVALMTVVTGSWAADNLKAAYKLQVGDTFTSGQTVDVKSGDVTVATITYGEAGGADFQAATANTAAGFVATTPGNGTNGNKPKGTFYTITPKKDGYLDVGVVLNKDKAFYILEDGVALPEYDGITVASKLYGSYWFACKADKAYKIYASATKLGFYGFRFVEKLGDEIAADNFDFTALDVKTSSSTSDAGDLAFNTIFKDSKSGVSMTYQRNNPMTGTITRFWTANEKPQLRIYSGKLVFEAPEDMKITKLVFNVAKWNDAGNAADLGELEVVEADKKVEWTGQASKVEITIAANTQLNNVEATVIEPGAEPYAVLADGVLTFKLDKNKPDENAWFCSDTEEKNPEWNNYYYNKVVFDDSFKDARPKSCYQWFAKNTLTAIVGIDNLNTSEVTTMYGMFQNANNLEIVNVTGFDTKNVTDMGNMFLYCYKLAEIDVTKFNTENVTNMGYMFGYCYQLLKLDVSKFDTKNVEKMDGMFAGCSGLTKLDVSNFNTEKVTDINCMFYNCSKLEKLDLKNFNTEKVTRMFSLFANCAALTSVDLSSFNTAAVNSWDGFRAMFRGCAALKSLDLSSFDTKSIRNMNEMFYNCGELTELDLSNFDTRNVYNMSYMFYGCAKLAKLNIDNFDTQYVSNYTSMFDGCAALTELNLMMFDSKNYGYNMFNMFNGCAKLATIKATNNFVNYGDDTMFTGCDALPEFDEDIVSGQTAIDKYCKISTIVNDPRTGNMMSIPAGEYKTLFINQKVKVYGDVGKLYTVKDVTETEVVLSDAIKVAAAKTPLIIFNDSEEDAKIMLLAADEEEAADKVTKYPGFQGTLSYENLPGSGDDLSYYMCNGEEFVKVAYEGIIPAYTCWLEVENTQAAAAPAHRSIVFGGDTTGISVANAANQKSADIFDLQGRKVSKAQKGMYIINGKKVVMK